MNFNSIEYLLFLPLVCIIYYLVTPKFRWLVLFVASCIFYMWLIPEYILCLFFLILIDFFLAKKIHSSNSNKNRKLLLLLSIISNFGLLFYFKYFNFFIDNINPLIVSLLGQSISESHDLLPIGLSFHTFQSVSYIVDVYKGEQKPEKHLGIYSNYVLFFPQMIAGPIERYSNLGTELNNISTFKTSLLKSSIPLFIVGFFYKMVIADNCGIYVNMIFNDVEKYGSINTFVAILLFSIQIYADFFGYSLIAQASARLFGINLIDNFKFPFFSSNIIEFWKRWHISLTAWFRNYVFLPLGGSRNGKIRHYRNIFSVFTLSGLWHGASWGFIVWGALHAILYILTLPLLKSAVKYIPVFLKITITFLLVSLIFVFFRCVFISQSYILFKQLTNFNISLNTSILDFYLIFIITFMLLVEYSARSKENFSKYFESINVFSKAVILIIMTFLILIYSGIEHLPFIYFQF